MGKLIGKWMNWETEPLHECKRPAGCEIFFPDLSMVQKLAQTEWKLISKHLRLSDSVSLCGKNTPIICIA